MQNLAQTRPRSFNEGTLNRHLIYSKSQLNTYQHGFRYLLYLRPYPTNLNPGSAVFCYRSGDQRHGGEVTIAEFLFPGAN